MKFILDLYKNLKLQYKLILAFFCAASITFVIVTFVGKLNYIESAIGMEQKRTQASVDNVDEMFQLQFDLFTKSLSKILVQDGAEPLYTLKSGTWEEYAQYYQQLNDRLRDFVYQTDFLDSIYISYGQRVYTSEYALNKLKDYNLDTMELDPQNWIQFFSTDITPQTQNAKIIPAVIQVDLNVGPVGYRVFYGAEEGEEPICVWSFINERYVDKVLQMNSTGILGEILIVGQEDYIKMPSDKYLQYPEAVQQRVLHCSEGFEQFLYRGETFYFFKQKASSVEGIYYVGIFTHSDVAGVTQIIDGVLGVCLVSGVTLFSIMTFFVTKITTKPISRLTKIVNQIKSGSYNAKQTFLYNDEVGQLGNQLNEMYDTIQLQFEEVKQKEKQKAQAQIQMYSEQINPHFLYNTLECIHFQILNNKVDTAAKMIESLGSFLRITLSHGHMHIPLFKEIEHVVQYMKIINRHSQNERIEFVCHCDEMLRDKMVLKSILQPLVENSVKHGFSLNSECYMMSPRIEVSVSKQEDFLVYQVTDNGKGINVEYANRCIHNDYEQNGHHFGLRNIYTRIQSEYAQQADMWFESFPYYRNSVFIKIPLKHLTCEPDEENN